MAWQKWWGVSQWAAYLEHMELPVKAASQVRLRELEATRGEMLAPKEYADLLLDDPLLALRLLKEANRRLPRRLAHDITTPLGVVLALGTQQFKEQIDHAPKINSGNLGFQICEMRSALAARVALGLGGLHYDTDSGELALAALLANAAEVELWAFAPDLPQAAYETRKAGQARRSEEAQRQVCGFSFRELTLKLIDDWNLPPLIRQLVRGDEGARAQLARVAVDTARHLSDSPRDPALPHDVKEAARLTGATVHRVVESLPLLDQEDRGALLVALQEAERATAN